MTEASRGGEGAGEVLLARDLRIGGAAAAYAALRSAAEGASEDVALDGGEVEKVDAAGLQALIAGRRLLAEAGKATHWRAVSAPLRAAADLLGLASPLGINT